MSSNTEEKFYLSKSKESLVTSINSILNMPQSARFALYESEEGRNLIKGLQLEAEQFKKLNKDNINWTREDIDRTIQELKEADWHDRSIMLQLLPGPVLSIVSNLLNKPSYESHNEWTKVKGKKDQGTTPEILKGVILEKGANKMTPSYDMWKQKVNQTMAQRRSAHQDGARFFVVPHEDLKEHNKTGLVPREEYDKAKKTKGKSHHVFYRRNNGSVRKLSSHGSEASALDRKQIHDSAYQKQSKQKGY